MKQDQTHVEELDANKIIKHIPVVNKTYLNHITGEYLPVVETTNLKPNTADSAEAPKENESILRNVTVRSDLPTAIQRITLTLHQTRLRRLQELENREEDNMRL